MDLENYNIKTHIFEGPLDLLLSLIEKKKLLINDISLAQVADDYISYVKNIGELPIGDTAQFVLIASTLILIKSKSLLPNLELSSEEEQSINDLEDRLLLRAKYRELGENIRSSFGKNIMFFGNQSKQEVVVFSPDSKTNTKNLAESLQDIMSRIPKKEMLPKAIIKNLVSLEEVIVNMTERMSKGIKMSFKQFTGDKKEKVSLIVSFLAMLELVKQGIIKVEQNNQFDDIEMEHSSISVPRY